MAKSLRILLTSWGSGGDLNPFLSLGHELLQRGHTVKLVGNPLWKEAVEGAGIAFRAAGPELHMSQVSGNDEVMSKAWFGLVSLNALVRDGLGPIFEDATRVLIEESQTHDVLISHHFVYPAAIAAEETGIGWATVCLAPGVTPSSYSQPAGSYTPALSGVFGRALNRFIWESGRFFASWIVDPRVNAVRHQYRQEPQYDAMFSTRSRQLVLHLFSEHFAPKPPDWNDCDHVAGFCFWDGVEEYKPPLELTQFLESGPAPWVFTLGTTSIHQPGWFYEAAVDGLQRAGLRGILLTGKGENAPCNLPAEILALEYAPHGWLMPRCAGVAHQSGVGTMAQALRAGLPSLACPFAFDQPNNSTRLEGLGVGRMMREKEWTGQNFAEAMIQLSEPHSRERARALGEKIRAEDGPAKASEIIEQTFKARS